MAASKTIRTYNPAKIIVTFGGVPVTGYVEDSFVKLERNGDVFEVSEGADGTVDRTNRNAFSYVATIVLKQVSPTNDAFMDIMQADQSDDNGIKALQITDIGGTLQFSADAWIEKDPSRDMARKMGSREWKFRTGIPSVDVHGSN